MQRYKVEYQVGPDEWIEMPAVGDDPLGLTFEDATYRVGRSRFARVVPIDEVAPSA